MTTRMPLVLSLVGLLHGGLAEAGERPAHGGDIRDAQTMTRDQADAILTELRAIHRLLERQQNTAAAPAPVQLARIKMSVVDGWQSIGRQDAPVTLVEFADYQCPYCKAFHTAAFADLKRNYIDTGKVRFVSRDLPLDFHPNALKAAEATRCAADQGRYWEMRESLIANSSDLSPEALLRYAQALPLDMASFRGCLESGSHRADVQKDQSDATALQISGTPTFVVARTTAETLDGLRLVGAQPYAAFDAAIRQVMDSGGR